MKDSETLYTIDGIIKLKTIFPLKTSMFNFKYFSLANNERLIFDRKLMIKVSDIL